eukprot:g1616.t1
MAENDRERFEAEKRLYEENLQHRTTMTRKSKVEIGYRLEEDKVGDVVLEKNHDYILEKNHKAARIEATKSVSFLDRTKGITPRIASELLNTNRDNTSADQSQTLKLCKVLTVASKREVEEIKESKSLAETSDGFSLARSTPLERNKRCGDANLNNLVDSGGDANLNHLGKVDSGGGDDDSADDDDDDDDDDCLSDVDLRPLYKMGDSKEMRVNEVEEGGVRIYERQCAVLGTDGRLRVVEAESHVLIPLRPRPKFETLDFARLLPNRSCVVSDERPLMPALRKKYVAAGQEMKEILFNRDFNSSDPNYRRMLTGVYDHTDADAKARKTKSAFSSSTSTTNANVKVSSKAKRDDQIIWHQSCPLRKVQMTRGGYFFGGGWFLVSIYSVGINGRIFTIGSNAPRHILIEAYNPETSKMYDLRIEMNKLPGLLGDLPSQVLKEEMRRVGLNPQALDDRSMLVPLAVEPSDLSGGVENVCESSAPKDTSPIEDEGMGKAEKIGFENESSSGNGASPVATEAATTCTSVSRPVGLKAKERLQKATNKGEPIISVEEAIDRVECVKLGVHRQGALRGVAASHHFRRGRFQLWKKPTTRRRAVVSSSSKTEEGDSDDDEAQGDDERRDNSSRASPASCDIRLVPVSDHPAYQPFLDHVAHVRAVQRLLQPGHRDAVIKRIMKLVYFQGSGTKGGERVLCVSSEEKTAKEQRCIAKPRQETPEVSMTPRRKARWARVQRRRRFRRSRHRMAIVVRRLWTCARMLISVYVKPMYGRCFYVRAYCPKTQTCHSLPVAFTTAYESLHEIVRSAIGNETSQYGVVKNVLDARVDGICNDLAIPKDTKLWNESMTRQLAHWITRAVWLEQRPTRLGSVGHARLRLCRRSGPAGPSMANPPIWHTAPSVGGALVLANEKCARKTLSRITAVTTAESARIEDDGEPCLAAKESVYRAVGIFRRRYTTEKSSVVLYESPIALPWFEDGKRKKGHSSSSSAVVRGLMRGCGKTTFRELREFESFATRIGSKRGCRRMCRTVVRLALHPSQIVNSAEVALSIKDRAASHMKGIRTRVTLHRAPPARVRGAGVIECDAEVLHLNIYIAELQRSVVVKMDTLDVDAMFKGDGIEKLVDSAGLVISPTDLTRRIASERLSVRPDALQNRSTATGNEDLVHVDRRIFVTEAQVKVVVASSVANEASDNKRDEGDDGDLGHVGLDVTDDMLFASKEESDAFLNMGNESKRVAKKMKRKSFVLTNKAGGANALHALRMKEKASSQIVTRRVEITVRQHGLELEFSGRILRPSTSNCTRSEMVAAMNDWEKGSGHKLCTQLDRELATEFAIGFRGSQKTIEEREATLIEILDSLVLERDRAGWLALTFSRS